MRILGGASSLALPSPCPHTCALCIIACFLPCCLPARYLRTCPPHTVRSQLRPSCPACPLDSQQWPSHPLRYFYSAPKAALLKQQESLTSLMRLPLWLRLCQNQKKEEAPLPLALSRARGNLLPPKRKTEECNTWNSHCAIPLGIVV